MMPYKTPNARHYISMLKYRQLNNNQQIHRNDISLFTEKASLMPFLCSASIKTKAPLRKHNGAGN
ncbi:hypothetical protein [Mucilaginibacter pedocola]|uniref:Uncharacterized protein n=1 Tax=Mucilaginibacter pedocola TaxID=1792845 RepID=A0A1S9PG80_9SPHI|nr:hypothetical protein [Mucilaginibacter pedocola]OOQ59952.1 hypothetical protein BC343_27765 [Mucilaginibacter pedocola]